MARPSDQRGSALIFVTIIGLVMTIAFTLFMGSTVAVEERAVEAELARSRVYWAQMGNFAYSLSRISYSKLCDSCKNGNNKDTDLALVWQAYFNELSNRKTWSYADESPNYTITINDTAIADTTAGRQTFSGYLMATAAYTGSALLAGSAGTLPPLELRLCTGLNNAGAKCGNLNNNNGGNATAYFSINRLTSLPAP